MQLPLTVDWVVSAQLVLLSTVSHTIVNPRENANVGPAVGNGSGCAIGPGKSALVVGPVLLNPCDTVWPYCGPPLSYVTVTVTYMMTFPMEKNSMVTVSPVNATAPDMSWTNNRRPSRYTGNKVEPPPLSLQRPVMTVLVLRDWLLITKY